MSGLWIAIAAVSATAAGVLLLSLAKHRSAQPRRRADFDLVVFKDQLAELERDRERGDPNGDYEGAVEPARGDGMESFVEPHSCRERDGRRDRQEVDLALRPGELHQ